MPGSGLVAEPGFEIGGAGQGRDQDAAGFGLPPGIDDGAAAIAHHAVIPQPGFRIDRLAHAAQQAQGGAAGLLHRRVAVAHQGADGGGRGVEDVDLVLVDHLPEARGGGIVGHAFEHQGGGAVGQRAIDDIAVAGHPADIGGAPIDIAFVIIEHILMGIGGPEQIAARGVQHALGLAGRARGVKNEQRVFRVHRFGRAVGGDLGRFLVIPDVAAVFHRHLAAGALDHDHGR